MRKDTATAGASGGFPQFNCPSGIVPQSGPLDDSERRPVATAGPIDLTLSSDRKPPKEFIKVQQQQTKRGSKRIVVDTDEEDDGPPPPPRQPPTKIQQTSDDDDDDGWEESRAGISESQRKENARQAELDRKAAKVAKNGGNPITKKRRPVAEDSENDDDDSDDGDANVKKGKINYDSVSSSSLLRDSFLEDTPIAHKLEKAQAEREKSKTNARLQRRENRGDGDKKRRKVSSGTLSGLDDSVMVVGDEEASVDSGDDSEDDDDDGDIGDNDGEGDDDEERSARKERRDRGGGGWKDEATKDDLQSLAKSILSSCDKASRNLRASLSKWGM